MVPFAESGFMDKEKIIRLEEPIITSYNIYAHLLSLMQAWYGNTAAFQNWFVNQYLILKCFHNDLAASVLFDDPFNENRMGNRFMNCVTIPREFLCGSDIDVPEFFKKMISNDYAVYLWLEQYYIPQNKIYFHKEYRIHDPMIYGYNEEGFMLADFYNGQCYSLNNFVDSQNIYKSFCYNNADNLETSRNINSTSIVCVKSRSFIEYEYDPEKLKYVISRHLRGGRFQNGYMQDFDLGIDCYDFLIELLLKGKEKIDIRACHVFYDHKKATCKAIEYLIHNGRIRNGEQLKKKFNDLAELAQIARNMAMKYNIKKDNKIIDRLITIYKNMKQSDKECFENFYYAI